MMMLNRLNQSGTSFKLREIFGETNKVHVQTGDKKMVFNTDIRRMDYGWAAWKDGASFLLAFIFLSPDERYFLMTGELPE